MSIHVKLDYNEALNLKKSALMIEKELLETAKNLKNYNMLRKKEFLIKAKIKKDMLFLENQLTFLSRMLPFHELGNFQKAEKLSSEKTAKQVPEKIEKIHRSIDIELQEIKEKLARL
jgi:hypothetical protein